MRNARNHILEWAESGRLKPDNIDAALVNSRVLPDAAAWRNFIGHLFLWLGATLVAVGIILFLAYNWQELGRFAKFALVEGLIVAAIAISCVYSLERAAGKAALLFAALNVGALMALFGQTYQTGADPWQLFASWALVILPWALVARFAALWLVWLMLVNLAVALYYMVFPGIFGVLFSQLSLLSWSLFALNTIALVIWELLALRREIAWLQQRWAVRVVVTASGVGASILAFLWVFDAREIGHFSLPIYLLWMGAAYWFYRFRVYDLYVLAGGVFSAIVVIAALLGRHLLPHAEAGGFLFIGLLVIGMSAAGARWLKNIATENSDE
ncbi:MAG: DUF2157 domain-containing protein [Pseudomonadota bacterium]